MNKPDHHTEMTDGGWSFQWEPATYFISARHPRGGVQSVLEIRNPDFRYLGPVIAEMMNVGRAALKAMEAGK